MCKGMAQERRLPHRKEKSPAFTPTKIPILPRVVCPVFPYKVSLTLLFHNESKVLLSVLLLLIKLHAYLM